METRPSNARGPTVTTLVAGLGLFLLIVVFTLSTLCAAPSAGAGITPSGPPGIGTVHSETHQDPVSPPPYLRAAEAPDHGNIDNSMAPSLRVISFSLAGLASSEPRFNGLPSSPVHRNGPALSLRSGGLAGSCPGGRFPDVLDCPQCRDQGPVGAGV